MFEAQALLSKMEKQTTNGHPNIWPPDSWKTMQERRHRLKREKDECMINNLLYILIIHSPFLLCLLKQKHPPTAVSTGIDAFGRTWEVEN